MKYPDILLARQDDSTRRLNALRSDLTQQLGPCDPDSDPTPQLCIYVTGSLARLEATEHSDLDAFFFLTGCKKDSPLSRIRDVKVLNSVISASERQGFPDFSNDGEYLKFLHIDDVLDHIGGREDDYQNAFTARMLLILESAYLYNESLYLTIRDKVINHYFTDFHRHTSDFRPIFLLNDILRFWRTLCLNYENGRHWRGPAEGTQAKGHLDNFKLRFSRLNICFSFICALLSRGSSLSPEDVAAVSGLTPITRLKLLADNEPAVMADIAILLEEYGWFLDITGRPKDEVLNWISDRSVREMAFVHADNFIGTMYRVVHSVAQKHEYLRYLVI